MEPKQTSPFSSKPIILSPPPLNSSDYQRRQQSVGYNLQQEFETLSADLDLDLKDGQTRTLGNNAVNNTVNINSMSNLQNLNSISAPVSSHPKFNTISPIPTNVNASQAGLGSLLNQNFFQSNIPNRPQSVNDYTLFQQSNQSTQSHHNPQQQSSQPSNQDQSHFYLELMRFTNWIENLNPQDNLIMIDYLCNNLPLDILMSFQSKLNNQLNGNQMNFYQSQQQQLQSQNYSGISSPYQFQSIDLNDKLDHLNLNDNVLHQPKPRDKKFNNLTNMSRPRSAEPSMNNLNKNHQQYLDRAKSPTNHLFEKTNFLQLAAARSPGLNPSEDQNLDMSQKLGALATINSRVALDSNKKHHSHFYDPSGRNINSNSVPLGSSNSTVNNANQQNSKNVKSPNFKSVNRKNTASPLTVRGENSNSSMPIEVTNLELLNNIPAWLKLLRLHKYTDCLKDINWKDLIELNDEQLEDKGVKALGARRKLLKAFDVIKTSS
ncbi:RNA-binding protein Vts1p [[Candida] jaroonii]|uniref:RNA-binding protein Vts1p n=1 Tax=[Candida] jaroonii TaxID=467808 RepID=A0ACA9Y0A1_9ASCO|nr:RNA-binding protein Vts1p [[Candida] jaroonii]